MKAAAVALKRTGGTLQVLLVRSSTNRRWVLPAGHLHSYENESTAALRELEEEAGYKAIAQHEPIAWYVPEGKREGVACILCWNIRKLSEAEPGRAPTLVAVSRAKRLLAQERSEKEAEYLSFVLDEAVTAFLLEEAKHENPHTLR